jgi:hypothetical protein
MFFRSISATFLFSLSLGAVGCVGEDAGLDVGTVASEVDVDQLQGIGWKCYLRHDDETMIDCSVCYPDDLCRSGYRCTSAECNAGGAQSCIETSDHCFLASYDAGQNYWFEAEGASRWAPMVAGGSTGASGGSYVTVPVDSGAASNLRYAFTTEEDVELYAWARVQVPSPVGPDDTWINMDNEGGWSVQLPTTGNAWEWVRLIDSVTGELSAMPTPAGDHKFRIYSNATGVRIDRVLLTRSASFVPYSESFEAESSVHGSMVKVVPNASTWANPGYAWVPNGVAGDGHTQTEFVVPQQGQYAIWGRVKAANTADNMFKISTDFAPLVTWAMPVTGTKWAWHQVTTVGSSQPYLMELLGSYSTIEFFRGEDGTKLDRFLITNDPGFLPADVALGNSL